MADMTFNTVAGQPVDRELLILFVNTGTDSAAVWSPLGTRVTDSSMEYDWQKDSNKDILGTTRTTMKKPIITQDFEPCELDAGDVALMHVWNLAVKEQNAAALANKLSQMANGAIYDDAGNTVPIHEQKLNALEDIIESANGKPLLVAYWYQHDLERIMKRLHDRHIPFSKLDKADSIRRWNNGEIPVALIHPASAGHGLNLQTGGNTIVWFGLTWSLELYSQTIARLWRQGQTAETVVVQHIVTDGTIDEQILRALKAKDKTQSALIAAVKANLKI